MTHLPQMLQEIVEAAVSAQPDMELASGPLDDSELDAAVAGDEPVILVAAEDRVRAGTIERLLTASPQMSVVSIGADGRSGELLESDDRHTPLGEASPARLVAALRAHASAIGAAR